MNEIFCSVQPEVDAANTEVIEPNRSGEKSPLETETSVSANKNVPANIKIPAIIKAPSAVKMKRDINNQG